MRRLGGLVLLALLAVLSACSDDGGSTATSDPPDSAAGDSTSTTTGDGGPSDTTGPTDTSAELPSDYVGYTSDQYADGANWMCHPATTENICDRDLDSTVVYPGGETEAEPHEAASDPSIDCFYIYPTISADPGTNSDLDPAEGEEIRATLNQVARLNSVCRVFAPVYRQFTVTSLVARFSGEEMDPQEMEQAGITAYGDVLDAWKQYMANDNNGRGVILVGHSQGSGMLTRLIAEEIDDEPLLRDHLVAAYLPGTDLAVPEGGDVGGTFQNIPLCSSDTQTGCVVTWDSFPASNPPRDDSLFGVPDDDAETPDVDESVGMVSACVNPAALAGGSGDLEAYFTTEETMGGLTELPPVDTDWVALRDSLTAECKVLAGHSVLEVTVNGDPTDTRDQTFGGGLPANWGLHLADVNLAMGNLVTLARSQAAAYADN